MTNTTETNTTETDKDGALEEAVIQDIKNAMDGALDKISNTEPGNILSELDDYFIQYATDSDVRKNDRAAVLEFFHGKPDTLSDTEEYIIKILTVSALDIRLLDINPNFAGPERKEALENISVIAYATFIKNSILGYLTEEMVLVPLDSDRPNTPIQ